MDCAKTGELLKKLRVQKGLTQKNIADKMNISDKTVSKWERGLGCPDVSLLSELSDIYGVNISSILSGSLDENNINGGNMKKIKFYFCPVCKNIAASNGNAEISCCGRKLEALKARPADEKHKAKFENVEDELFITLDHEMTKEHYISFIAYADDSTVLIKKLYPEQNAEARLPDYRSGHYYAYCSDEGLFTLK